MKKLTLFSCLCFLLLACSNEEKPAASGSENEIDAARNFIRAALDGKWDQARSMIVQDSTNNQFIDMYEELYQTKMKAGDKRGYREANITFYGERKLGDSVVVVNYSNTYKNLKDSLKLVNIKGQWLVDFKYSFPAGRDSVQMVPLELSPDSLEK